MRWLVARVDGVGVFDAVAGAEPVGVALFGDLGMKARMRRAKTLPGYGNHGAVGEPT